MSVVSLSVTAVNCGALANPSNGTVDTSSGTTFMMTATYTCNPGYTLTGDMTRTCQADGMWNSSEPACECECDLHSFNTTHCSPAVIVLSIGGTVYTNNTALSVSLIGEGSSALTCHTELSTCCREQDNPNGGALGGWRGPDGVGVPSEANFGATAEGFYVTRNVSTISLNQRGSITLSGGVCCTIPRAGGANQIFCVNVQGTAFVCVCVCVYAYACACVRACVRAYVSYPLFCSVAPTTPPPVAGTDVGPIVGGVIVAVIAIVGIVVGIIVAVIFVR